METYSDRGVDRSTNYSDLTNCDSCTYDVDTDHEIGGIMMNLEKNGMISKFIHNHYTNISGHKSCLEDKILECCI